MDVQIPISVGELIDKLTILEIKAERISDANKLENILKEKQFLIEIVTEHIPLRPDLKELRKELKLINEKLWHIEDRLRDLERKREFGAIFIEEARAVYFTNDRRAEIKRQINQIVGSSIVEEKSYQPYH